MVVALALALADGTWVTRLCHFIAPTVSAIDNGTLHLARDAASSFFHVVNSHHERQPDIRELSENLDAARR